MREFEEDQKREHAVTYYDRIICLKSLGLKPSVGKLRMNLLANIYIYTHAHRTNDMQPYLLCHQIRERKEQEDVIQQLG